MNLNDIHAETDVRFSEIGDDLWYAEHDDHDFVCHVLGDDGGNGYAVDVCHGDDPVVISQGGLPTLEAVAKHIAEHADAIADVAKHGFTTSLVA